MLGSDYLDVAKRVGILSHDSHLDGDYLMLKITPQFLRTWKDTVAGNCYQRNIKRYILLAIINHSQELTEDDVIGIAVVLSEVKDLFAKDQTDLQCFVGTNVGTKGDESDETNGC